MDADKSTNDEGDQDVNIGADVLPPPPCPHPKPKRKVLNNLTANEDWLSADRTPPTGNIITDDLIDPVLWKQSQKQQTHIQAQISMNPQHHANQPLSTPIPPTS